MSHEIEPITERELNVTTDSCVERISRDQNTHTFSSSGGDGRKWMAAASVLFLVVLVAGGLFWRSSVIRKEKADEAARVAAHQAAVEQRARELGALNQTLSQYQQELDGIPSEVAALDSKMQLYLSQHPQAVIALCAGVGGGSVAIDANNEYSQEAKAVGGIAAFLAVMWASQNMEEVNAVLTEINRASEEKKGYIARTELLNSSVTEVQARITDLESRPIVP